VLTDDELTPNRYAVPEVEDLLHQAIDLVAQARPSPMSTTVRVHRDELLELLEQAAARLPEELRAATWLLREREELLEQGRQERDQIIEAGATQVERMIQRQEITKAAEARARQIVVDAQADARTLRRQTEDFCDQRLASFEAMLERTLDTVRQGRRRLAGTAGSDGADGDGSGSSHDETTELMLGGWVPFDQDRG